MQWEDQQKYLRKHPVDIHSVPNLQGFLLDEEKTWTVICRNDGSPLDTLGHADSVAHRRFLVCFSSTRSVAIHSLMKGEQCSTEMPPNSQVFRNLTPSTSMRSTSSKSKATRGPGCSISTFNCWRCSYRSCPLRRSLVLRRPVMRSIFSVMYFGVRRIVSVQWAGHSQSM